MGASAAEPSAPSAAVGSSSEFRPGLRFYAAFSSLCIVILAAALDATSLSTALPVRSTPDLLFFFFFFPFLSSGS